jgi:hypothetical protein
MSQNKPMVNFDEIRMDHITSPYVAHNLITKQVDSVHLRPELIDRELLSWWVLPRNHLCAVKWGRF